MRKEQIITTNNNQMEEKGMMSRFIHFKKRFVPAVSGVLMGVMLMSTTCFAAGFILCEMQIDTILWGGYNKKNCASKRKYIF